MAAINVPGWGGRPVPAEYEPFNAEIEELIAAGKPLGDVFARRGLIAAGLAIPEWRATIDALTGLDWIGAGGRVGYWGLSLGHHDRRPAVRRDRLGGKDAARQPGRAHADADV